MITELRDRIAYFVSKNCSKRVWKSIRETYSYYSYLAFLCLAVYELKHDFSMKRIGDIAATYHLEDETVVQFVLNLKDADVFVAEILDIAKKYREIDVNGIYQEYLTRDYMLCGDGICFEGEKDSRDVLGAYYTQEDFSYEITKKAIDDYCFYNPATEKLKVADLSCGGGAFLLAVYRICREKKISVSIWGYDVDPIAVLITRFRIAKEMGAGKDNVCIVLGNPLIRQKQNGSALELFRLASSGKFYHMDMGILAEGNMDIIVGNPPWEKIRFEEKKFLKHYVKGSAVNTKSERIELLSAISHDNLNYYNSIASDYEEIKKKMKADAFYAQANCGELNTYALFTKLSLNLLSKNGITGLIVKSSLVKIPVYSGFFRKITYERKIYELYMFVNRKKIFQIDSREEFSVIYLRNGNEKPLEIAMDLEVFKYFSGNDRVKVSYELLNTINPYTGMIPNVKNKNELEFLISVYERFKTFGEVYPSCKFGRLVHLTNHSDNIIKNKAENYDPIYEGKFIELYTGNYATFKGMIDSDKYKNKAMAKPIKNIDGEEFPEARFFVDHTIWEQLSKNFKDDYVVAWRSLTSATNRRTMLATALPLLPTCQSIQLLQLPKKELLRVLAVFNSIIFDYIVRLKMAGLDLTQMIIKQIPVPCNESFEEEVCFQGVKTSFDTHIHSRLYALYKNDFRMKSLFDNIDIYTIEKEKSRKEIIAELDKIIAILYHLDRKVLRQIAYSFSKYYSKKEVESWF